MNYWTVRIYRRKEGSSQPVFAAAYIVGMPEGTVAKDLAKPHSFIRDSPRAGYPPDDEPFLAAIVAEGHCHLILGLETGQGWSTEATAAPYSGPTPPEDDAFTMEGLSLWVQERGDFSRQD